MSPLNHAWTVCAAVHFVEGEKSVHRPKQIRITGPVQFSPFTDEETETEGAAGAAPDGTATQQGRWNEDPGQPPFSGRLETHPPPTEA